MLILQWRQIMHRILITAGVFMAAMVLLAADKKPLTFKFAKADMGKVPAGWKAEKTGKGEGSEWKVVADDTAPSKTGFALAQTAQSGSSIFNLCVVDDTNFKDVEATVAFKANEGKKDQGGGIVWRYQDANNYYIARMNPLEDNFRVYKVIAGKRSVEFQDAELKIPAGECHTLKIKQVGEHIECFVDGKKYLNVKDDSITKAGKVGLWTKADAQTSFDNLQITDLGK
jgi:Domain of Unknown Function (DUF1080)